MELDPNTSASHTHARSWAPRIWLGCSANAWWRLLRRNGFAVGPSHLYIALVDSLVSPINSGLGALERLIYGRKVDRQPLPADPIFIVGHWRTGTTLLHELLCLDSRNTGATAYACSAPHHFLLTEQILPRILGALAPTKRPMDEMRFGFDSPFEDEFALCLLGAPSPYDTIAFPNRGPITPAMLDPRSLGSLEYNRWRACLLRFYRKLCVKQPNRRLVLKSPPHTCRIRILLELFPRAKFVHIVRNPYQLFPSTVHLWRTLHRVQGLQTPKHSNLEEMVFSLFLHLHSCLERDRSLIPPGQFHELRYEDLVRDPVSTLRLLYEQLQLEGFKSVEPAIEAYFAAKPLYQTNRYTLKDEERDAIRQRWGSVIQKHGYEP